MPFPFLAVGAGLALANAAGRFLSGNKQTRESKKITPVWRQYQSSPYAKMQLATAQNLYNARTPGASRMERNILASQGNYLQNVNRLATDSSQALALGALGLGQTDQALQDLQLREEQNRQNMLQNLNQAYGTMISEGDKEYQSMVDKYGMDVQRKDALRSAGAQNKYGAFSDLASMAFTLGSGGMGMKNAGGLTPRTIQGLNNPVSTLPYNVTPFGGINGGLKQRQRIPGLG